MKLILSEKNIVAVLFILVIITYSLAQQDFKKMEKMQEGLSAISAPKLLVHQPDVNTLENIDAGSSVRPAE